jgi:hypothetical protein
MRAGGRQDPCSPERQLARGVGEGGLTEIGGAAEGGPEERGVVGEGGSAEPRTSGKGRAIEPGAAVEGGPVERGVAVEGRRLPPQRRRPPRARCGRRPGGRWRGQSQVWRRWRWPAATPSRLMRRSRLRRLRRASTARMRLAATLVWHLRVPADRWGASWRTSSRGDRARRGSVWTSCLKPPRRQSGLVPSP